MSRDSPFWIPCVAAALHSTGATPDVLRGYLRTEMIGPLPLLPLGRRPPQTADPVFRKILAGPHFTWAEHSQALLRNRKALVPRARIASARCRARLRELIGR
jgi:hypothetical protein